MAKGGPRIELRRLLTAVREYEVRYLDPHLSPTPLAAPSRAELLDVAAFVVLTHGAFENFVEGLALWAADRIETNWKMRKRVSRGTAALLLHAPKPGADDVGVANVYDTLRVALESAKDERSDAAKANNGIALKHLRRLFAPVGVDVPTDPILLASLEQLVKMRHQWAHQYRHGVRVTKGASDVKTTVSDCMSLAERLSTNVRAVRP